MAASIFIEQESGTFTKPIHRHNGYYAGDFSTPRATRTPPAHSLLSVVLESPSAPPWADDESTPDSGWTAGFPTL